MSKLYLTNGEEIDVEGFQPKQFNLIKIRLHKDDEFGEGVWTCLDDETKKLHDDNTYQSDYIHYATLRNDAFYFQFESWGLIIPIKFNGNERPECNISIVDFEKIKNENNGELIFNKKETI